MPQLLPILQKPDWGQPCNHCGRCCMATPCGYGIVAGEKEGKPCGFLEQNGNEFHCGLMRHVPEDLRAFAAFRLGFGMGCDSEMK